MKEKRIMDTWGDLMVVHAAIGKVYIAFKPGPANGGSRLDGLAFTPMQALDAARALIKAAAEGMAKGAEEGGE
jgi:hypothetical protein